MREKGYDPDNLDAIFVSHEHGDHIQSAGVIARRFDIPICITEPTMDAAIGRFTGNEGLYLFDSGDTIDVGDLSFVTFRVPHDAVDPVNFIVSDGNAAVAILCDLGWVPSSVFNTVKPCDLVIVDSNYDYTMLMNGWYPPNVKERIRDSHLSNKQAAKLLCDLASECGLRDAILIHLSSNNNRPETAIDTCTAMLRTQGVEAFSLGLASQHWASRVYYL